MQSVVATLGISNLVFQPFDARLFAYVDLVRTLCSRRYFNATSEPPEMGHGPTIICTNANIIFERGCSNHGSTFA